MIEFERVKVSALKGLPLAVDKPRLFDVTSMAKLLASKEERLKVDVVCVVF